MYTTVLKKLVTIEFDNDSFINFLVENRTII